jgi:hypothetical protein
LKSADTCSPARGSLRRFWLHLGSTLLVLASLVACRGRNDSSLSPTAPSDGASAPPISSSGEAVLNGDLLGTELYPSNNWWNRDISGAPVDPSSRAFIDRIGDDALHPDFGPPPFGIPYIVVPGSQPRVPVNFVGYPAESDEGAPGQPPGYPIPDEARTMPNYIEGGAPGGGDDGDRHLLVLDRDQMLLFETWATSYNGGSGWEAGALGGESSTRGRPVSGHPMSHTRGSLGQWTNPRKKDAIRVCGPFEVMSLDRYSAYNCQRGRPRGIDMGVLTRIAASFSRMIVREGPGTAWSGDDVATHRSGPIRRRVRERERAERESLVQRVLVGNSVLDVDLTADRASILTESQHEAGG